MNLLHSSRGRVPALALLLGLGQVAAPAPALAKTLPFEIKTVTLENGLRLVMVPYASPGLIAYYTMVRVGSRDEVEPGVTGFAHFFEHMMFRGTPTHTPEVVSAYLKKTGADQNGFTTDDFTCYTFFGRSDYLEELVRMEADRFQNLAYSEDVFKTESKAVLGEYNKSASSPWLKLEERLRELTFQRHTYGHTTLGYLADIEAMPTRYAYSKTFFSRYYTPDNSTVVAVGDFDPAVLEALVRREYGGWKTKRATSDVKPEPPQTKALSDRLAWKTPTLPMLSMSWRTPATRYTKPTEARETAVFQVLFELLFGEVSPAYTELVLEQQLVDRFSDGGSASRDPGLFHVVALVKDVQNLAKVQQRMDQAVAELAAGKLTAERLAAVKSRVRYGLLLRLSSPSSVADTLVFSIAPTGEVDALEKLLAAIEAVQPGDVRAFVQKYLTPKNRAVITLAHEEASR
jgi:zinc protease